MWLQCMYYVVNANQTKHNEQKKTWRFIIFKMMGPEYKNLLCAVNTLTLQAIHGSSLIKQM